MKVYADLHLHSTASDGSDSPRRVVERAAEASVPVIALTDHDTVAGLEEAARAAEEFGIQLISGVELTTTHGEREVHLLGFSFDASNSDLLRHCSEVEAKRAVRLELMIGKLNALGHSVSVEQVWERVPGTLPSRLHVAQTLIENGEAQSLEEVFTTLLHDNGPAAVALDSIETGDAIALLHSAGGIAVIAHPGLSDAFPFMKDFVAAGLDGVEVWHSGHSEKMRGLATAAASQYGLMKTGGSDCHGTAGGKKPVLGMFGLDRVQWKKLAQRLGT